MRIVIKIFEDGGNYQLSGYRDRTFQRFADKRLPRKVAEKQVGMRRD